VRTVPCIGLLLLFQLSLHSLCPPQEDPEGTNETDLREENDPHRKTKQETERSLLPCPSHLGLRVSWGDLVEVTSRTAGYEGARVEVGQHLGWMHL
jgi:hypothetical protein